MTKKKLPKTGSKILEEKRELPIEGERLEKDVKFGISNILITKRAFIQRLDDKVAIVIQTPSRKEAEDLVTSLGADLAP